MSGRFDLFSWFVDFSAMNFQRESETFKQLWRLNCFKLGIQNCPDAFDLLERRRKGEESFRAGTKQILGVYQLGEYQPCIKRQTMASKLHNQIFYFWLLWGTERGFLSFQPVPSLNSLNCNNIHNNISTIYLQYTRQRSSPKPFHFQYLNIKGTVLVIGHLSPVLRQRRECTEAKQERVPKLFKHNLLHKCANNPAILSKWYLQWYLQWILAVDT